MMIEMIFKKLLVGAVTLFAVISLTFFLLRLMPGGPFDQDRKLPPAVQANMEAKFHLDKPLPVQYIMYLGNIVRGDFGPSYKYLTRSVNDIIGEGFWVSLRLGVLALLLGVSTGLVLGTYAGMTPRRWLDGVLSGLGISAISMPSFIFGALLVMIFAYYCNWLPAARLVSPAHYILPVFTLALTPFAYSFMLIRSTVRETRHQTYVTMKRSMGIPEQAVIFGHILRNSLIPLISILGPLAAMIVTGSFAVELIFAIPGLGKFFISAVSNRDYTLVMGITIVYSVLLIGFNLFTDIIYGWVDPRYREQTE